MPLWVLSKLWSEHRETCMSILPLELVLQPHRALTETRPPSAVLWNQGGLWCRRRQQWRHSEARRPPSGAEIKLLLLSTAFERPIQGASKHQRTERSH